MNSNLTVRERQQALRWYIQGILLQTIANHFKISVNSLKQQLDTENE